MKIDVEELTLANLGGRDLEDQLRRALEMVAEAFTDEKGRFGKSGKIASKITITLDMEHNLETRTTMASAGLKVQVPRFRHVMQPVMLNGGRFVVEPDQSHRQRDMFDGNVHPIHQEQE